MNLAVIQHDPDDEPVAPPLDPEFFEFDCEYSTLKRRVSIFIPFNSAQG